mgnify:CR=1 FL=1
MLSTVKNDAEVQRVPFLFRKQPLQIPFRLRDAFARRQSPPLGEPMDVRIDRKGGHPKRLRHHHRSGLVAYSGQGLQRLKRLRHLAPVFFQQDL